jgi:hypothetical protein
MASLVKSLSAEEGFGKVIPYPLFFLFWVLISCSLWLMLKFFLETCLALLEVVSVVTIP